MPKTSFSNACFKFSIFLKKSFINYQLLLNLSAINLYSGNLALTNVKNEMLYSFTLRKEFMQKA